VSELDDDKALAAYDAVPVKEPVIPLVTVKEPLITLLSNASSPLRATNSFAMYTLS